MNVALAGVSPSRICGSSSRSGEADRRGRHALGRARRDPRSRRRVGIRQDDDGARAARLRTARRTHRRGGDRASPASGSSGADERAARRLRGRLVSYVPQDPGDRAQPRASDRARDPGHARRARRRPRGRLGRVGARRACTCPPTTEFARRYPHQLSGGQQQRVTIAIALVCEPPLVVLDEPTTGLDVVTQARVLEEVDRLRRERGSRDGVRLATTSRWWRRSPTGSRSCTRAASSRKGLPRVVLAEPRHPYTRGLVASIPDHVVPRRLRGMPGVAVGVGERPPGCAFAPRCPQKVDALRGGAAPARAGRRGARRALLRVAADSGARARGARRGAEPAGERRRRCSRSRRLRAVHGGRLEPGRRGGGRLLRARRAASAWRSSASPGAGKTTIARCVAGLHAPAAGPHPARRRAAGRAARRTGRARRDDGSRSSSRTRTTRSTRAIGSATPSRARPASCATSRRARGAGARWSSCSSAFAFRRASRGASPASSREASASASRSRGRWPRSPTCSSATRSRPRSTSPCRRPCSSCSPSCAPSWACRLLFISHDLGVVATVADRVLVLERGVSASRARSSAAASPGTRTRAGWSRRRRACRPGAA